MFPIILADNLFSRYTPTASGTAAGFDVRNIADLRPYTFWQAAAVGTSYITISCGAPLPANCITLMGHNLIGEMWKVTLQSSDDGIVWTDRVICTPTAYRASMWNFTKRYAAGWRLKIVASNTIPQLAIAMLGVRLDFPFPPDSPYIPYSESTEEETTISKFGHPLGTVIRYCGIEINPQFSNLDRDWLEQIYLPFQTSYSRYRKYFFYAWDLDRYPDQVFFVKDTAKTETPFSTGNYCDRLKLQFKGVAEI